MFQIELTLDTIHTLKYLDAFVSETLRLYPTDTSIERIASHDYLLDDTIKVDKGVIIHIPVYTLHRDPNNFPDPDSFKPERFLSENRAYHPYSYLPFSAGPRNCVAKSLALLEAKLAILHSVYNFKFDTTDNTDVI